MNGLSVCHAASIVHRDVKPDNFLACPRGGPKDGFIFKLCDFGLATKLTSPEAVEMEDIYGTPPFMAPDMLDKTPYCAKVDVWAIGLLANVTLMCLQRRACSAAPRRE